MTQKKTKNNAWKYTTYMCVLCVLYMHYLEPQTTIYKWMFGETTISYVKIWNHPIETTIYKWLFGVPGKRYSCFLFVNEPWNLPFCHDFVMTPNGYSLVHVQNESGRLTHWSYEKRAPGCLLGCPWYLGSMDYNPYKGRL